MSPPDIAMIVPSFNSMGYLRRTLRSFYKYSPWLRFVVVDDASTEWDPSVLDVVPPEQLTTHRFSKNGGLTRSWNKGYEIVANMSDRPEYLIFGNNDILANKHWWKGMVKTLESGAAMTGPLSNAAGVTAHGRQDIWNYIKDYKLTDDPAYLNKLSDTLFARYCRDVNHTVRYEVNGFFMMGRTETFVKNEHSPGHIFVPNLKTMPSGRKNKTPLMTGQEDELQHRLRKRGLQSDIALGSFVFHYRSVARGGAYAKRGGKWLRCDDLDKGV